MKAKLLAIMLMVLFTVGGCFNQKYQKLEEKLTELSKQYYEEQLKGKVKGFNMHEISLEQMEKAGYDISEFKEKKCDLTSYSFIKLELDENREVIGDNYEVENHLKCGNYSTEKQNENK